LNTPPPSDDDDGPFCRRSDEPYEERLSAPISFRKPKETDKALTATDDILVRGHEENPWRMRNNQADPSSPPVPADMTAKTIGDVLLGVGGGGDS
jgi:hypothetical protein